MQENPLDLYQKLNSNPHGLGSEEARIRLEKYGSNELVSANRYSSIKQILVLFSNPLVLILLIASAVSATLGDKISSLIILIIVLLSIILNFFQTYRSQRAVDKLRAEVALTANVLRDGEWQDIPRTQVVPGDVVRLVAGDLVPADAQLVESQHLNVLQAALTGESLPIEKNAVHPEDHDVDKVYLGTSIVSGSAIAIVTHTGKDTAYGDIVARLSAKPPETEFERGIRHFSGLITRVVLFLVLFVVMIGVAFHHNTLETVLFAISLAVGLTPEFLPMITTITLAQGATRMARQKVIIKHLESIQNFGSIDILCSDKTGTLTSGNMQLNEFVDINGQTSEKVLELATLNSSFETGIKSPLDAAILEKGLHIEGYVKSGEIPFDFERRRLSVIVQRQGRTLLICKGAPESILEVCSNAAIHEDNRVLDDAMRKLYKDTYQKLSSEGYRLLSIAYKSISSAEVSYNTSDEQGLTLAGFLTFLDPPLEEAKEVLKALYKDGVRIIILTGDNELVTQHICAKVGVKVKRIILGSELDHIDDQALLHHVKHVDVFARISPTQKNRIILALKKLGHVVGYIGDGINDAPSLHTADVGISVAGATDVAREAAEIILLEKSLRSLHNGIIEGRKAFGNVMKYLLMGTSSNFGNMFSMAGAYLFLPFLPMLPTQILLNNFLYDLSQVSIPTDNVDQEYIRKPHHWDVKLIRNFMIFIGPISSIYDFLTFWVLLAFFNASQVLFHTGWFVESLATQTLVLFVIRTTGNPLRSRPSKALAATICAVVFIGLIIPFIPFLAKPMGFTPLPPLYFLFLLAAVSTYLVLVEVGKRVIFGKSLQKMS